MASGTRVWKIYFYSQALHETLGHLLTIGWVCFVRYEVPWIIWPLELRQYVDPLLRFALLLFCAVLIRQIITKHLTYVVNQERYAKAVQDLLFKGQVLQRLCDADAYQPLRDLSSDRSSQQAAAEQANNTNANGSVSPVPFPYTPLLNKRGPTGAAARIQKSSLHPLYDVFYVYVIGMKLLVMMMHYQLLLVHFFLPKN